MSSRLIALFLIAVTLTGCMRSLDRDKDAAKAKVQMIGMTREEVLSCMGPPKKKAHEDATEVWSYASTDRESSSSSDSIRPSGYSHTESSHDKSFCTVNVVMRDGTVTAIHYLGPTATNFYNTDDQCGYAVKACVE